MNRIDTITSDILKLLDHTCTVTHDCHDRAERRRCGHWTCDAHTDALTNLCLWCVPVDQDEYDQQVSKQMLEEYRGEEA